MTCPIWFKVIFIEGHGIIAVQLTISANQRIDYMCRFIRALQLVPKKNRWKDLPLSVGNAFWPVTFDGVNERLMAQQHKLVALFATTTGQTSSLPKTGRQPKCQGKEMAIKRWAETEGGCQWKEGVKSSFAYPFWLTLGLC